MRRIDILFSTALAFVGVLLTGCASLSALQTARTIEKGKTSVAIGAGYMIIPTLNDTFRSSGIDQTGLPLAEVMVRRGVGETVDVGLKFTFPTQIVIDSKWNFVRTKYFDMAADIGFGYRGSTGTSSVQEFDLILPLFFNLNLGQYFTIYLSPKYFYQSYFGALTAHFHFLAGTGGIRIGAPVFGILAEATYANAVAGTGTIFGYYQANGALYFSF